MCEIMKNNSARTKKQKKRKVKLYFCGEQDVIPPLPLLKSGVTFFDVTIASSMSPEDLGAAMV